jgi:redox-sensitive bicupin YhaK (pirin superfamily)
VDVIDLRKIREIKSVWSSVPTIEGAGVRLHRVFGFHQIPHLDPFLLLDHFGSANPADYLAGFPWHPHRGIETITYMISGYVKHGDSLGNGGVIGPGDVQWMTAGSGIIHEEMPQRTEGTLAGFQLWANLPASQKMIHPKYRDVTADDITHVTLENDIEVKIVAGHVDDSVGPVTDVVINPEYLDVFVPSGSVFNHPVVEGHTVFAYLYHGSGKFSPSSESTQNADNIVLYNNGDSVSIEATSDLRFLLVSGKPLNEPIAWRGPIVMNTDEELRVAFSEYHEGTFLKHK